MSLFCLERGTQLVKGDVFVKAVHDLKARLSGAFYRAVARFEGLTFHLGVCECHSYVRQIEAY